ncbi:hypothetical protein LMG26411_08151 [Cupriavidus numazuensis]|uniref:S-adenosylhomocysteine hydrolase n=2 Tax=Cupriavidus numazuensis TaxID=221992 RepID=A0ABN7QJL3_9BURK|nr:hypothetical protein LMG26411_08151 [Cupriavidus numazuensis]
MAKMSIQERIERTLNNSTAKVFVRKEFDKFGSYDQVGRVLRSMMAKGLLVKAGYGIYVKAKKSSVTGNNVPAIPLEQIGREALSKLGVKTDAGDAAKAYRDGRTTQMPMSAALNVGNSRVTRKIGFGGKTIRYER